MKGSIYDSYARKLGRNKIPSVLWRWYNPSCAKEIRLFGETLVGFGMNEDSVPECERWRLAILFKVGYNIWYSKNLWTEDNYGKKGS